ncbi:MAG: replication initiation protein RepC, partial [Acetobacteraceae bacterium]
PVPFPAPPAEALTDPVAADAWFDKAVADADEILYRDRPGMPHRVPHDAQVFALARAAKPTRKGYILAILSAAGQLAHLADDRPVSDGAGRLLGRLAALLDRERCEQGSFRVTACNATLAQEMGKSHRTIVRYLAELQAAGFLYRHYTTGSIGLDRPTIDLGPLVSRLSELEAAIADRAAARVEVRAERARCATLSEMTGGDDRPVVLNTNELEFNSDTVSASNQEVAPATCAKPEASEAPAAPYQPTGRPDWTPKPRQVVAVCPTLAAYVTNNQPAWPDLVEAAYCLTRQYELNKRVWETLCLALGREWAALTVALVAEKPPSTFTRCRAPRIELKRASYLAGIARKLVHEPDKVSITASWYRHVKQRTATTGPTRFA